MTKIASVVLLAGLFTRAFAVDTSHPEVAIGGGETLLHWAAGLPRARARVQARVVTLLLDRGAAANALDKQGIRR